MASLKKRAKEFETPYPVTKAITKGDAVTKLSMLVMGLGNLAHKQIVKGILFLAVEIAYILFMIEGGINNLYHLITLGGRAQEEVWNEAKGIYEYTGGDMTILFLLYGVATIFITVLFFMIWRVNMKSAYEVECRAKEGVSGTNISLCMLLGKTYINCFLWYVYSFICNLLSNSSYNSWFYNLLFHLSSFN